MIAQITLTLVENGSVNVSGNAPDNGVALAMLEQAKVALLQQSIQTAMQAGVQAAIATAIPPFHLPGSRHK